MLTDDALTQFEEQGFLLIPKAFEAAGVLDSVTDLATEDTFAIRNLLDVCPAIKGLTREAWLQEYVSSVLGTSLTLIRAIYFDKIPRANWKVPWHQDPTIAVKERFDCDGFTHWSIKAGVHHVQPPVSLLENTLTLRLHLDSAVASNGALRVIPGSHKLGKLSYDQIKSNIETAPVATCNAQAGDLMLMRPLLLHASSSGEIPSHRRIIHLEFNNSKLPESLRWYGT